MGYETTYKLQTVSVAIKETDPLVTVLGEKPRKLPDFEDLIGNCAGYSVFEDSCKWYENEEDMTKFSAQYPDVLFILDGFGEEEGDIWRKYFRAGKMFRADAVISFARPPAAMMKNLDIDALVRATANQTSRRGG